MKILHVIKHCGYANGNVNAAVDLACAQSKAGLDVSVASAGGAMERILSDHQVKIIRIADTKRSPIRALWALVALCMAVLRSKPDIIHAHMVSSVLLSQLPKRLSRARLITTVHNAFEHNARIMGWADRVIAVSRANANDLIARGMPRKRVHVVRNGPIGSARLASPPADIALAKPAILSVCGLHPRKRVEDILDAASLVLKDFPEAHFYFVGEGPDQEKLERRSAELGIAASVHFVGYRADPLAWMKAADIFVLASCAEPFGLVLAEARSQGCAIIATNVDGIPEVLEHGKAGILVPPLAPTALAREIIALLSDHEKLRDFQERAKTGMEWLTTDCLQRSVLDVYLDALQSANRREEQGSLAPLSEAQLPHPGEPSPPYSHG